MSASPADRKRKAMKKILYFVLTMVCLFVLGGCGGGTQKAEAPVQKQAAAETVLRVGTDADYPPFEYYQEASKAFTGFDIELMQGVAQEMGYSRVEFVNLDFDKLLPALNEKKVDAVISCLTVTEERKGKVDFTEPYLDSPNVVVALTGAKFSGADTLKDKSIAVEAGSIHVKESKKYSDKVVECSYAGEALKMVADKKADFAIMDHYTARFFITHNYNSKLTVLSAMPDNKDTGIAIAVAKGNKEMLDKVNAGLGKYKTTAAFMQLKNTYFGKLEK